MRKLTALIVGGALAASMLAPLVSAAPAGADTVTAETSFVQDINAIRARSGSGQLAVDTRLTSLARWWAGQMQAAGTLKHNPNLAAMFPAGWTLIGENVGVGGTEASLEYAFEHSPEHLANMLDHRYSAFGLGVVMSGSTMWVAEEYMAGVQPVVAAPPPTVWTGWGKAQLPVLPAGMVGAPGLTTWGANRLDQFARGNDGNLWHNYSDDGGGQFSGWENLLAPSGGLKSSPSAVSWGYGRIDVFARGGDNALWHKWFDGTSWSGWQSLGGNLTSAPAVSSWAPGRLDVFAAGVDHGIWHMWYDHGWSGWEPRGGYAKSDPAVASWAPGRIDLFSLSSDNRLWHSWYDGVRWSGWASELPGTWSSGPAAVAWGPGRLDVFLASATPNRPMIHAWYAGGWDSESRGGALSSAPVAVSWHYNRLDVLARGTDGNVFHNDWPGS